MNRLIILDNLRHGWMRLLVIGILYVGFIAPASNFLVEVSQANFSLVVLGFLSMKFGLWIKPGISSLRKEMHIDCLLPIPRAELVNTLWLLRTIYPAACLTLFFLVASLLGLTQAIEAMMPAYLPVHVFAAYACGFSAMIVCNNLLTGLWSGNRLLEGAPIPFLASVIVPSVYLALLSNLRGITAAVPVFLAAALLIVVATYRTVCSQLLVPMFRRPPADSVRKANRFTYESKIGGFRQLTLQALKISALFFVVFVSVLAIMAWLFGEPGLVNAQQLASVYLPLFCFLVTFNLNQHESQISIDSRVLRALPLTAGTLALRIIALRCAGLTIGFLCLTPLFVWTYGTHMGFFLANVSIICVASASILIPTLLWLPSAWGKISAAALCIGTMSGGLYIVYQSFTEGSLVPLATANLIAAAVLFMSYWLLKKILSKSSQIYRSTASDNLQA